MTQIIGFRNKSEVMTASDVVKKHFFGNFEFTKDGLGFETFLLTNNLQNIKRLEARVKLLHAKQAISQSDKSKNEYEVNGVKVCENFEADRLQILFDEKPEPEMINKLKRNGFRWSPFNKAWQRKLTSSAKFSLKHVLAE